MFVDFAEITQKRNIGSQSAAICWFAALTRLLSFVAQPASAAEQPNVVLIVTDDLGWADLGCYGSTYHRTPQLDRLAENGKQFTQAYAACPVCSPTRAALMTGKVPGRLHLTDWLPGRGDMPTQRLLRPNFRQELPLEEVTVAEAFQIAGYATAQVGKWHLGGHGFDPTKQGFDVSIAGDERGSPASYFAPFGKGDRVIPGLADAPQGQYLTDRLTDETVKLIETNRSRPFFLYLAHYGVHTPLAANAELQSHYAPWDGVPRGRQENPIYAAMLESVDESVGRIVAKLSELDLNKRTIVMFTSDNGGLATREGPNTPSTINAPLREGKGWLYEGGIRVPLIVSWPGHIQPGTIDTPVFSGDLPITALALCGQRFPTAIDSVDLSDLLLNDKPLAERPLYWHYPHYANQGSRPGGAIREGDWKLIEFYDTGRRELFNLARDPSENKNRSEDEPEQVERLAAKLAEWRAEIEAQMPAPNPGYTPNPPDKQGVIVLPARTADVHGVMLRYEPLPHKQTLGFWVKPDDWAEWEFGVPAAGEYHVEALVGCGKGSGGSNVQFTAAGQTLDFVVTETGGFQEFQPMAIGTLTFAAPGRFRLEVRAVSKPGPAVMDLREVKLAPVRH